MTTKTWEPLYPTIEGALMLAQPERFRWPTRAGDGGWIGPIHSPLREDKNPSFAILPDSPTDAGGWTDFCTGEHGSMADLVVRMGFDPRRSTTAQEPKIEPTFGAFCLARRLDQVVLVERWRVKETTYQGRPAIRFPTSLGVDRIKYLDHQKPKSTWAGTGGHAHLYGWRAAVDSGGSVLYIVNGEPAVWAASQSGVAAVCFCVGEGTAPSAEVIEEIKASSFERVAVIYDRDEAGRTGARKLVETLTGANIEAVALELPESLGTGGDVDDLHRRTGDAGLGAALEGLPELGAEIGLTAAWPPMKALPPSTEKVPKLPPELLPEAFRAYLVDASTRAAVALEMVAVPVLTLLSSIVGTAVGIRPERYDDWTVVPNLWGAIIASPGALKSFCISVGTRLVAPLIEKARADFEEQTHAAEEDRIRLENENAQLKSKARGKSGNGTEAVRMAEIVRELEQIKVVERRLLTNDATTEKIGEILRDNSRGIAVERDELTGQFRNLDKPGREGDREFYLEAWNGDSSFTVDRIGRGTIRIPNLCISLFGGIQPGKLDRYVSEAIGDGGGADGLLQRFQLLAYPDGLDAWSAPARWPNKDARITAESVFASLAELDPESIGASQSEGDRIPWVRWSSEAQALWNDWRKQLEDRLRSGALDACPAYAAHVAKYRSFMPSLALLIELADWAAGGSGFEDGRVSINSARRAAALVDYFDCHARKIYSAELNPGPAAAQLLAKKIKSGEIEHLTPVRELRRAQWSGLRDYDSIRPGLDVLEDVGMIRVTNMPTSRKPVQIIEIRPEFRKKAAK